MSELSWKEIRENTLPETVTIPRELFERLTDAAIAFSMVNPIDVTHLAFDFEFEKLSATVAEVTRIRDAK